MLPLLATELTLDVEQPLNNTYARLFKVFVVYLWLSTCSLAGGLSGKLSGGAYDGSYIQRTSASRG